MPGGGAGVPTAHRARCGPSEVAGSVEMKRLRLALTPDGGHGSACSAPVVRQDRRAGDPATAHHERARRSERRPGRAGRAGDRQDGAAATSDRRGVRFLGGPRGRRRVGDGAPLRRAVPAVRADARPARVAGRASASRAQRRVRACLRRKPRPVPGRPRGAQPHGGDLRGAADAVRRGRRAVARPGLGPSPRIHRAPPAGGAGSAGLRGPHAGPRSSLAGSPGGSARTPAGRTGSTVGSGAAGDGHLRSARRERPRPDSRGGTRPSTGPARALPRPERRRPRRRVRSSGRGRSAQAYRGSVRGAPK